VIGIAGTLTRRNFFAEGRNLCNRAWGGKVGSGNHRLIAMSINRITSSA
jgi:hypothetical protein